MTEQLAEKIIDSILIIQKNGILEDDIIISKLMQEYEGGENDFHWIIEMINMGAFRASIMSSNESYPNSNIKIEDNVILKTAFKKKWIELKGEEHYMKNYQNKNVKWWNIFKKKER